MAARVDLQNICQNSLADSLFDVNLFILFAILRREWKKDLAKNSTKLCESGGFRKPQEVWQNGFSEKEPNIFLRRKMPFPQIYVTKTKVKVVGDWRFHAPRQKWVKWNTWSSVQTDPGSAGYVRLNWGKKSSQSHLKDAPFPNQFLV